MCDYLSWLPPLVRLEDYGGDWSRYEDATYEYFWRDFVDSRPTFEGKRVGIVKEPRLNGKEFTFSHVVSKGPTEPDRLPDLRRYERIRWPRPMIEAAYTERVNRWENQTRRDRRVLIAVRDFSYLVVLADRKTHVLLWTAYYIEHEKRRERYEQEYLRFTKGKG